MALLHRHVAVDRRPGRDADLHEGQAPAQIRTALQEQIQRFEPLRNALRVVEPVDADAHDRRLDPELGGQPLYVLGERRPARNALYPVVVDADRDGLDRRHPAAGPHRAARHVRPELVARGGDEVAAVALQLESQQVVGEQPGQQLAPPRADAEPVRMRPRNVPEQRRPGAGTSRAQGGRHQRQVVVLNEHRRRGVGQLLLDDGGEALVDALVCGQSAARKFGRTCASWHSGQSPSLANPS